MSEKAIQARIILHLQKIGAKVIKTHGSIYSRKGTPDLIGSYQGRAFGLEVKQPGQDATELQQKELSEWQKSGAITGVVRSIEDVISLLASALHASMPTA